MKTKHLKSFYAFILFTLLFLAVSTSLSAAEFKIRVANLWRPITPGDGREVSLRKNWKRPRRKDRC